MVVLFKSTEIK